MLSLVGTDGKIYYTWALEPGSYVIGRLTQGGHPNCNFAIDNKTVSRKHAQVDVDERSGDCFLTDLGSHNGTMVNGRKITDRVQVVEGDMLMFGQAEFRIAHETEPATPKEVSTKTRLTDDAIQNSIFLSIDDALKPLPTKVTEMPELVPTLFDMAKMLALPEPKDVMLEKSLGMIAKIIPAERLAVFFVSEDQNEVIAVAVLIPGKGDSEEFTLSRTIVREIMTNKNSVLICDPLTDPRFAQQKSIILSELKSAIAVPLFDEGRVLGILYVDTSSPLHRYDDDHLRVLATFGNIIASRLLNYELLSERQEKQLMERELERASSIQKNLLVEPPSKVGNFEICAFQEQSRSVGGDLYDVKTLPDGRLLFVVADVSGKGMGAALLMSNILASLRILYDSDRFSLAETVKRISLQMNDFNPTSDFATMFIGLIDPGSGTIQYVNAGHNPPMIVRNDKRVEELDPTGFMIGAFDFGDWTEKSVELSEGECILVFTDGVTEAQLPGDPEHEAVQYGEERLSRFIANSIEKSPGELIEALMTDIDCFINDDEAPRSDDITMLAIKRAKS